MTMSTDSAQAGKIITFYSYKGGTGRSMAVANIACLLASALSSLSQRVLVMDWDLEAPGLHRFFPAQVEKPENTLQKTLQEKGDLYKELVATNGKGKGLLEGLMPLDNLIIRDVAPGVDFIKAGKLNAEYAEAVNSFHWADFFNNYGLVIEPFRELLASKYAYCLIDSRTGFTDVSGICTMLLPEKLVMVFIPNRQNLAGVTDLAVRATDYRRGSSDFRPLAIFPLPSRIENAEHELKQTWRKQYQQEFEKTFREIYQMEECELTDYFNQVQLPYHPYYSYGEKIAVTEERSDALSLSKAYRVFLERLINLDFAWDTSDRVESGTSETISPIEVFTK
jgi:MinD-like ATPase involved in chromosome partitioning or flagellar assembly